MPPESPSANSRTRPNSPPTGVRIWPPPDSARSGCCGSRAGGPTCCSRASSRSRSRWRGSQVSSAFAVPLTSNVRTPRDRDLLRPDRHDRLLVVVRSARRTLFVLSTVFCPALHITARPSPIRLDRPDGADRLSAPSVSARLLEGRRYGAWIAAGIAGLAMLESAAIPLPVRQVPPVAPVYAALAHAAKGPVAEFPFFYRPEDFHQHAQYVLQSTVHWQPLINGFSDFYPDDFKAMVVPLSSFPTAEAFGHSRAPSLPLRRDAPPGIRPQAEAGRRRAARAIQGISPADGDRWRQQTLRNRRLAPLTWRGVVRQRHSHAAAGLVAAFAIVTSADDVPAGEPGRTGRPHQHGRRPVEHLERLLGGPRPGARPTARLRRQHLRAASVDARLQRGQSRRRDAGYPGLVDDAKPLRHVRLRGVPRVSRRGARHVRTGAPSRGTPRCGGSRGRHVRIRPRSPSCDWRISSC